MDVYLTPNKDMFVVLPQGDTTYIDYNYLASSGTALRNIM